MTVPRYRLQPFLKTVFPFSVVPILLLVSIFYLNFICRIVLSPLLPVIEQDLGLGHGKAGSLFLFMALGYGMGLLGSGFVASRLNYRQTILLSAEILGAAMIAISQSASLFGMSSGLIIAGLSAGFYLPSAIAIITDLVNREHWGKAIAFHEIAPNLGFITAPLLAEVLLRFISWRGILGLFGCGSILMGFVFSRLGRGGDHKGEEPRIKAIKDMMVRPLFWNLSALCVVTIGASFAVYSMMPLFLVTEVGMDRGMANTLVGLSRLMATGFLFLSGWILDRYGHKQATRFFVTATGLSTLLLGWVRAPLLTPILILLQAVFAASLFPCMFTLMPLLFPPSLRGLGLSLVVIIGFFIGGGAIPWGIGILAENLSFSAGFSLLGILSLSLLPLVIRIESSRTA